MTNEKWELKQVTRKEGRQTRETKTEWELSIGLETHRWWFLEEGFTQLGKVLKKNFNNNDTVTNINEKWNLTGATKRNNFWLIQNKI